jgi:hypothetical protein
VVKRKWKLEKGEELNGVSFAFFFPQKNVYVQLHWVFLLLQQCENSPDENSTTSDTT